MTAVLPDTGTIEDLDFEVPCEFGGGDLECQPGQHPADWYVATHCAGPLPICDLALRRDNEACASGRYALARCLVCDELYPLEPYRILGPVR